MKNIKKTFVIALTILILGASIVSVGSAAVLGERTLKAGIAGEDVKELQTILNKLGFDLDAVDGVYGINTTQAVRNLQAAKSLKVDGIAGPEVFEVLLSDESFEVSRSGSPERYKQVLDIVATAYAPGPHDNGKWGNLTHIGTQVRPGIIAVDPRVIPLRSRVYIEFPDGHGMYAVAEDTGGAIKGNRIDIAMWTVPEAYKFGMQNVKVFVLS